MKKNGKQKTKKNLNNFEITVLNDSCWNDSVKTTAFHNLFIMINKQFCLKLFCLKFFLKKNQFDVKTNLVKKKSVKQRTHNLACHSLNEKCTEGNN